MQILVGAELIHADRRTDMTKLIGFFFLCGNAPKNWYLILASVISKMLHIRPYDLQLSASWPIYSELNKPREIKNIRIEKTKRLHESRASRY
jgi:hypothetical protein